MKVIVIKFGQLLTPVGSAKKVGVCARKDVVTWTAVIQLDEAKRMEGLAGFLTNKTTHNYNLPAADYLIITMLVKLLRDVFLPLALAIACALPTVRYYYFGQPVMFESHDHIDHVIRLYHITQAFQQGVLAPNWLTSFTGGLGSPIFLFSYYLGYYAALPLVLWGMSLADSIKVVYLVTFVLSGVTMYWFCHRFVGTAAALAGSALFMLAPYRLSAIFIRNAYGEAAAFFLIPLVLVLSGQRHRWSWLATTGAMGVLMLFHNVVALMGYGLFCLWMILTDSWQERRNILVGIIFSLGLTAFFWIPAKSEIGLTHYQQAVNWYAEQFPSLGALINSPWQYGPPMPWDQAHSMSFQIGKVHWLVMLVSPVAWLLWHRLDRKQKRVVILGYACFIGTVLLQLSISKPVWDRLEILQVLLYSWKLQSVTVLGAALIGAVLIQVLPYRPILVAGLVLVLVAANRHHFFVPIGEYAGDAYVKGFFTSSDSGGEILPKWASVNEYFEMRQKPELRPKEVIQLVKGVTLINQKITPTRIEFRAKAAEERKVVINQYYFPGWTGTVNGQVQDVAANVDSDGGRMSVLLVPGENEVDLQFSDTPVRRITKVLSGLFLVVGGLGLWVTRRPQVMSKD